MFSQLQFAAEIVAKWLIVFSVLQCGKRTAMSKTTHIYLCSYKRMYGAPYQQTSRKLELMNWMREYSRRKAKTLQNKIVCLFVVCLCQIAKKKETANRTMAANTSTTIEMNKFRFESFFPRISYSFIPMNCFIYRLIDTTLNDECGRRGSAWNGVICVELSLFFYCNGIVYILFNLQREELHVDHTKYYKRIAHTQFCTLFCNKRKSHTNSEMHSS